MASAAFTSAGTTIGVVSGAPATFDQAGFGALTFTAIGEITSAGEFGRQYNLVTHNPLDSRETIKRKGSFNSGTLALEMGRVPADVGQVVLVAGADSDTSHSFEVTLQDGTILYFTGQIMSYTTNVGSTDQITTATVNVEIDSAIVEV